LVVVRRAGSIGVKRAIVVFEHDIASWIDASNINPQRRKDLPVLVPVADESLEYLQRHYIKVVVR
jgi:hypothetical protein